MGKLTYFRASGSILFHGLLFIAEIITGLRTHSICLLVHGLHALYRAVEEVIIVICAKIPQAGTTKNTFGWARMHVLGVTINSVFLAALCFSMFVSSLKRLVDAEHTHDPILIVILGSVGMLYGILSLVIAQIEKRCSCKQKKDESSTENPETELFMKRKNQLGSHLFINERWAATSMAGAAVILANGLILSFENARWTQYVDAVASIIMIIIIIGGTLPEFKSACLVLMQAVPGHIKVDELAEKMKKAVPGIDSIHEFHLWQLTGRHVVATVHIKLNRLELFHHVADRVKEFLQKEGVHSVTVQPETGKTLPGSEELRASEYCELNCGPSCVKKKCC